MDDDALTYTRPSAQQGASNLTFIILWIICWNYKISKSIAIQGIFSIKMLPHRFNNDVFSPLMQLPQVSSLTSEHVSNRLQKLSSGTKVYQVQSWVSVIYQMQIQCTMITFNWLITVPLHVARHSVEEFSEVNPMNSPVHSPGMSHCKAAALPRRRKSGKMGFNISMLEKLKKCYLQLANTANDCYPIMSLIKLDTIQNVTWSFISQQGVNTRAEPL